MKMLFSLLLALHIIGGGISLLIGFFVILIRKGDKRHKIIGRIFFVSMLLTGVTSLALAALRPNYFLFMVGVFTLYMVSSGFRYINWRNKWRTNGPAWIDWIITGSMLLFGLLFIGLGIAALIKSGSFGFVFLAFGFFGLLFVRSDINNFRGKSNIKNYWITAHLQRMTGAFIASLTAFLVVNASYMPQQIPGIVYWLLPSVIFTPLIISWSREWGVRKKSTANKI